VVCLSTIGADAPHENLLTQRTLMELSLEQIGLSVTFLRPGWFMENALWDVPSARDEGVLRSFLQPADKLFPMVATQDVGDLAARASPGERERERGSSSWRGPHAYRRTISPAAFAMVLKRAVRVEDGAARELGADFPLSGKRENPFASDPDARRLSTRDGLSSAEHGRSAV